jgi:hypothetical protein
MARALDLAGGIGDDRRRCEKGNSVMRWEDFRRSDNVEDDRDGGFSPGFPGGGIGLPTSGLGIGSIIVIGLIGWALGIDPSVLIGGAEMINRGPSYNQPYRPAPRAGVPNAPTGQFVAAILGNTEDVWSKIFQDQNQTYRAPRLRLYAGAVEGGCGMASAAMGPFYCPRDRRVYLDTSFFRDIQTRFRGCSGKACEFAQAYVIAHEVGHHVQNLIGVLPRIEAQQRAASSKAAANRLQVRVELQADCFAGVWANKAQEAKNIFEPGDIEAALNAASAIGDDRIQKQTQGYVVPDSFTHGSSAQRVRWFKRGYQTGDLRQCDTFNAEDL